MTNNSQPRTAFVAHAVLRKIIATFIIGISFGFAAIFPVGFAHAQGNLKPPIEGCLKDSKITVTCTYSGTYTVTLSGSSFTGNTITMASQTSGVTVTPPQQPWAATTTWIVTGATTGQTVILDVNASNTGGGSVPGTDQCCSGKITIVMPECPPPPPIDVSLKKTGFTSPPDCVNQFSFTLWPVNQSLGFTGNQNIVIHDTVPPNMTFTSYGGPNWSCLPIPASGGTNVTCTYTGAGPPAGPVSLGTITFNGVATVPPPYPDYTNSGATIGFTLASGLHDIDLSNNTANSVTLHKTMPCGQPAACNPATSRMRKGECVCLDPKMSRDAKGVCKCPAPQVLNADKICACPPPLVPGAIPGSCICPNGGALRDGVCVPVNICTPPQVMIPGVGCRCPDDEVLLHGKCVEKLVCHKPAYLNRHRTACLCPRGMEKKGKTTCVERKRRPHIRTEDIIRGIPGLFGHGSRGGGGGGGGQGGGAGGGYKGP